MPLKPCWNKLVTSGKNTKTCLTLISGQKWKFETGFTSNNVNPKFNAGSLTPLTTPASTWQHLYLHLKPVQKMFVLVSILFSLQIQTWKLVPNFVLQTSNTPQNYQEESLYWFLTEYHTGVVWKTPKNRRGTVFPIALALVVLTELVFS